MQSSTHSSPESAPFRLEWRPSRWPVLALLILAPLAAACALASGVPRVPAWLLAVAALAWGLRQARRQLRRQAHVLVLDTEGGAALDGAVVQAWQVGWRGPLAIVHLVDADGASHSLDWWPDTLCAQSRRELRLAGRRGDAARHARPVAP